jgi:hypothetical protein
MAMLPSGRAILPEGSLKRPGNSHVGNSRKKARGEEEKSWNRRPKISKVEDDTSFRVPLEEVIALGGDRSDLELIADVESASEYEETESTEVLASQTLIAELTSYSAKLGIGEQAKPRVVEDPKEDAFSNTEISQQTKLASRIGGDRVLVRSNQL